jgi:hypothetical protein
METAILTSSFEPAVGTANGPRCLGGSTLTRLPAIGPSAPVLLEVAGGQTVAFKVAIPDNVVNERESSVLMKDARMRI